MKRPEHPLTVATMEDLFRQMKIDPADGWAYLDRRKAPPKDVRDALVAAYFPLVPPESFLPPSLTPSHDLATIATNMQRESVPDTRQTRVSRARLTKGNRKHPFVVALVAKGKTVTEFARELGYARATVQSWYDADADNARPIPKTAAERIQKLLGVPVSTWRRVVE